MERRPTTLTISADLRVKDPPPALVSWCKTHLILPNPEFAKLQRMGKWTGNTPGSLWLFKSDAGELILPFGTLREILPMVKASPYGCAVETDFPAPRPVDYACTVPLYDYQIPAVEALTAAKYGILQSPAGSGKTQMGIALIARLGLKTLWLTHTADLLKQSYERAALYMDKSLFGTITAGKVDIGAGITFATVQTLAKQDLDQYRDVWDVVIVDECHRVAGSPTAMTQFGRVLSHLAARRKYGLSATVHRADGLVRCTHAYLGEIIHTVPASAVAGKVMQVRIRPRLTGVPLSRSCLDTDGTLIYAKLIQHLTEHPDRNRRIAADLIANATHYNLILSDRLDHLRALMDALPDELRAHAVMIDGSMTSKRGKADREAAIEAMRSGERHYLFATYRLAKEGLDIPRLDRLYLTTPQTDYAIVTQSVGRIARTFPDKDTPVCYDYVDDAVYLERAWKKRCRHYRKGGGVVEEVDS